MLYVLPSLYKKKKVGDIDCIPDKKSILKAIEYIQETQG
jgi:hypothetical protein